MFNDDPQNSPSKVTKPVHQQKEEREREREKYTRAGPQSHTQTLNPILVEEQMGHILQKGTNPQSKIRCIIIK